MNKYRLSVAALVLALATGFVLISQTIFAYGGSNQANVKWVEVVANPPSWNNMGPRVIFQSSWLTYLPRIGETVVFDDRFPAEKIVDVCWGPLVGDSRRLNIPLLVILESAAGYCDDGIPVLR